MPKVTINYSLMTSAVSVHIFRQQCVFLCGWLQKFKAKPHLKVLQQKVRDRVSQKIQREISTIPNGGSSIVNLLLIYSDKLSSTQRTEALKSHGRPTSKAGIVFPCMQAVKLESRRAKSTSNESHWVNLFQDTSNTWAAVFCGEILCCRLLIRGLTMDSSSNHILLWMQIPTSPKIFQWTESFLLLCGTILFLFFPPFQEQLFFFGYTILHQGQPLQHFGNCTK